MPSFVWDLLNVRNNKDVKTLLTYEKCCGMYSVRVGTLILTFTSFFFNLCIIAFDWMAIHYRIEASVRRENSSTTESLFAPDLNSTNSFCDEIFPWLNEQFLSLWIIIPVAAVSIVSIFGFVGALLKWSILLIPYCIYRFCWFLFALIFFLPFLFVEFLILLVLSIFPNCPHFLVVFTWIVNLFENILVAILASELVIIVLEFHLMSVVFGCYLECKSKNRSVDEETSDVFHGDDSMHVAIAIERQKSYEATEQ